METWWIPSGQYWTLDPDYKKRRADAFDDWMFHALQMSASNGDDAFVFIPEDRERFLGMARRLLARVFFRRGYMQNLEEEPEEDTRPLHPLASLLYSVQQTKRHIHTHPLYTPNECRTEAVDPPQSTQPNGIHVQKDRGCGNAQGQSVPPPSRQPLSNAPGVSSEPGVSNPPPPPPLPY
uniref:Uncharacterized protein n=1 Tax=Heliothis virescens TaxID=7102 RepID=A0A2A4JBJ9_HELVI